MHYSLTLLCFVAKLDGSYETANAELPVSRRRLYEPILLK